MKKGDIDMKSRETVDEITEVGKTKKRNAELMKKTETAEAEAKSVMNPSDEQTENDDSDFRLFTDWSKKVSAEDKKRVASGLAFLNLGPEQQNSQMLRASDKSLSFN